MPKTYLIEDTIIYAFLKLSIQKQTMFELGYDRDIKPLKIENVPGIRIGAVYETRTKNKNTNACIKKLEFTNSCLRIVTIKKGKCPKNKM